MAANAAITSNIRVQARAWKRYPTGALRLKPDLIFDLGMHHGHDSEYYLKKGFRVVAVEANPLLARKASEWLADWIRAGMRLKKYGVSRSPN